MQDLANRENDAFIVELITPCSSVSGSVDNDTLAHIISVNYVQMVLMQAVGQK